MFCVIVLFYFCLIWLLFWWLIDNNSEGIFMCEVVIVDSVWIGLVKFFCGKFNLIWLDDMVVYCVDVLLVCNDFDLLLVDDCIVGVGFNEGV